MLSAIVVAGMTWSFSLLAQDEQIERWKQSTWRMTVDLDTPNLVPPAVQWTIVDKDPTPGFSDRVKTSEGHYRKQLAGAADDATKKIIRSSQMTVNWDLGFKDVSGDKVYLLTSAPGVSHMLSSNGPSGKKWIVSKIVQLKGTPACWCIPVDVETGKEIHITLSEKNTFDLAKSFDKAIMPPVETE
jgi:hypothetical protein